MAYTVHLDQDKAKELARTGASLLMLNVPEGTRIGIDHQVGLGANQQARLPCGDPVLSVHAV